MNGPSLNSDSIELASAALKLWHPMSEEELGALESSLSPLWFPPADRGQRRVVRNFLVENESSPLARARSMALLRHVGELVELAATDYNRAIMLELASRMSLKDAAALALVWPEGGSEEFNRLRGDDVSDFELFAEDFGCLGHCPSAWVSEESLDHAAGSDPTLRLKLINGLRWLRLTEVIPSCWAAETMVPRVMNSISEGVLVWSVSAPLGNDQLERFVELDQVIHMDDYKDVKNPSRRRRLMVEELRRGLRAGHRVGCVANHSTVESRRPILKVARELGASSIAVFFERSEEEIFERNARAGWPVAQREVERGVDLLEAPRPHEAEKVLVVDDHGHRATWELSRDMLGDFCEQAVAPLSEQS